MHENAQAVSLGCGPGGPGACPRGRPTPVTLSCVPLRRRDRLRRPGQGPGPEVPGRGGDLQPRRGLLERGAPHAHAPALAAIQLHQRGRRGREALRLRGLPRSRYPPGWECRRDTALNRPNRQAQRGWAERLLLSRERCWNFWPPEEGSSIQGQ